MGQEFSLVAMFSFSVWDWGKLRRLKMDNRHRLRSHSNKVTQESVCLCPVWTGLIFITCRCPNKTALYPFYRIIPILSQCKEEAEPQWFKDFDLMNFLTTFHFLPCVLWCLPRAGNVNNYPVCMKHAHKNSPCQKCDLLSTVGWCTCKQ